MKKRILIIAPQFNPIPSDIGGVEGLITDLINENETHDSCDFFVVSKEDVSGKKKNYKNTTIFYSYSDVGHFDKEQKKTYKKYRILNFFKKIIFNKFTYWLLKNSKYGFEELTFFGYLCNHFYKQVKPDAVIVFGYDKIHHLWPMVKKYGNSSIYYHLHYCREEDIKLRKLIPNTIATSDYVLKKWNKTKLDGENSVVIHHGVDFKKFHYNFDNLFIEKNRKLLGFNKDDFVVIFTGRFRPGKGIIQLLNAFELIKNNNIKLLLLGDFDSSRHDNERDFEDNVKKLIYTNKNITYVGFKPNSELSLYYACANAQVVPTVYEEAAGLVTIEGMLAGLPIIITKSGGMPEYVDDGCSFKLDIDDNLSKNIAETIIRLYNNPDLREQMSAASRKFSLEFSIEKYYGKLISFLLGIDDE